MAASNPEVTAVVAASDSLKHDLGKSTRGNHGQRQPAVSTIHRLARPECKIQAILITEDVNPLQDSEEDVAQPIRC